MTEILIKSLDEIPEAARQLINGLGDRTVVAFHGEMGAGKTTFINRMCQLLGVETDPTASPTFALINEYRSDTTAELIYHFDLYRVESLEEALDMGVEDYLDCGALCLIEWPEVIDAVLPSDTVDVDITVNPDGSRLLRFN